MAELKVIGRKMSNTKLKLSDLNPHLMCVLCGGYYIDATTIVECLHSFCRSCIVKHLESSKYCPICEVQVHKTKPLTNIRPDKTLQNIVYKLVPGLFENEMRSRRRFYRERPHYLKPLDSESSGEVSGERKIYVNDENITFSLVYHEGPAPMSVDESCREFPPPARNERRYFKCPTGVTVHHLKKLLRAKYDLSESNYRLDIYFRGQELHQDLTLLDVSYVYLWKAKGTLDLTYKIFENVVKRQKIEEKAEKSPMETCEQVKSGSEESKAPAGEQTEGKTDKEDVEGEEKSKETEEGSKVEVISATSSEAADRPAQQSMQATQPEKVAKENGVGESEVGKEVQLQISESGVMSVSRVEDSQIVRTVEEPATKVNSLTNTGVSVLAEGREGRVLKEAKEGKEGKKPAGKPNKPYKTIRCSPKTWHPVIPKEKLRPTLIKNSDEPRKPLKFFKMRNVPRFLGNPSGGVKPLFAEAADKPEEKKQEAAKTAANSILKIDPKTLRPIDKDDIKVAPAPSAPNLLTNPFIPNNNHFLFSDLHLLPPSATAAFKDKLAPPFKPPLHNGSFPFPAPSPSPPAFYSFPPALPPTKPQPFPFPDKMDPLLRASRLSPFGGLAGFNMAGFHASLPPSISRLLNPHHHFRKLSQAVDKRSKDESTKETTKRCDDSSFKLGKDEVEAEEKGEDKRKQREKESEKEKERSKEKERINGETNESASEKPSACAIEKVKDAEKSKDKEDKDKDR